MIRTIRSANPKKTTSSTTISLVTSSLFEITLNNC